MALFIDNCALELTSSIIDLYIRFNAEKQHMPAPIYCYSLFARYPLYHPPRVSHVYIYGAVVESWRPEMTRDELHHARPKWLGLAGMLRTA